MRIGATILFASAMLALAPVAANAATYVAQLEYRDGASGPQASFGTVTIDELNADTVKITVDLATPGSLFISNGGPHNPFVFDTKVSDTINILAPVDTFTNGGRGAFSSTPFGTFTNDIACCSNHPGAAYGETPPLVFTVTDTHGLTFAGAGATFSPTGVVTFGTGTDDHFAASTAGYLFSADIFDKNTGLTYNVAAMYAQRIVTSVPEPEAWSLMILGFGAVGAMARRTRRLRLA